MAIGFITMLTLEPSDRRVSIIGVDSFTILFDRAAIRCTTSSSFSLEANIL